MTTVTLATMLYTDGNRSVYGIFQGKYLRRKGGEEWVNINTKSTEQVGTEEVTRPNKFCYRCAEEKYATPDAPPVPWASRQHKHARCDNCGYSGADRNPDAYPGEDCPRCGGEVK